LVEHLFAALAAYNALSGVHIHVTGPEIPLLDGGARNWTLALEALGLRQASPGFRIAREASYVFDATCYRLTPGNRIHLEVETQFDIPLGVQRACFVGDLKQFRNRLAPARTFGFARDAGALIAKGRASCIQAGDILVFNEDGTLAVPARAPAEHELAAHKLLDFMGDSLLYGAVPVGSITAFRPGHTANHAMFQSALSDGVLVAST
jgi:UDP-3-O-[3-hydroxymyristoyl] N-acetylglucosamine deacetylase